MTNKKRIDTLTIIIAVLGIVIISILAFLLIPNKAKPQVLNVLSPNIIFVGETKELKITSSSSVDITFEHSYLFGNKEHSEETNTLISLTGIKSGNEEITIRSDNLTKKVNVLVCDKISSQEDIIDLTLGENKELDFNIDDTCLNEYSITITDSNIASYQNGMIISKNVGSTTLVITRGNENKVYTINVKENIKNKKLEFNSSKTEFKIGDKYNISLINKGDIHTCSKDSDIIKLSVSDEGCMFEAIKEGTVTIKAIDNERTAEITITIKNPIVSVDNITINPKAIRITKGSSSQIKPEIIPSDATDKTITYTSHNPSIASISNGLIKALEYGTTTIEARANNGKTAIVSIIVTGENITASYESNTLKYWIEQKNNTYAITNVWVEDAYSQFKTAITSPQNTTSPLPRTPEDGKTIITNTINEKNYQNKGLVAVNASAMVSNAYGKNTPSNWFGTSQIPLILHDGKIIRDSFNETIKTDETYIIYGLKRNGDLAYYKYAKGSTKEQKEDNQKIRNTIINDGVLYTFGFKPVLLDNGNIVDKTTSPNIRQAICQVDKNNFILLTNTSSNRQIGFSYKGLAETFKSLNCKTALNLDGGGSTCEFYKDNTNNIKNIETAYGGRKLSDMIYFVEK